MRAVTYGACSLDGFLAADDGALDWLHFSRDVHRPGRGICVMGGGELARSLLAADVVDEVGLNIHPVLLGRGVPLFRAPGHRIALELLECRTIEGGCVLATYRVRHAP